MLSLFELVVPVYILVSKFLDQFVVLVDFIVNMPFILLVELFIGRLIIVIVLLFVTDLLLLLFLFLDVIDDQLLVNLLLSRTVRGLLSL